MLDAWRGLGLSRSRDGSSRAQCQIQTSPRLCHGLLRDFRVLHLCRCGFLPPQQRGSFRLHVEASAANLSPIFLCTVSVHGDAGCETTGGHGKSAFEFGGRLDSESHHDAVVVVIGAPHVVCPSKLDPVCRWILVSELRGAVLYRYGTAHGWCYLF